MFLFYQAVLESLVRYGMSAWYVNLTIKLKTKLAHRVQIAMKVIGSNDHQVLQSIYEQTDLMQAHRIVTNPSRIFHTGYELLPSRRYRVPHCKLNCLKNSFVPSSIKFLNNIAWGCRLCNIFVYVCVCFYYGGFSMCFYCGVCAYAICAMWNVFPWDVCNSAVQFIVVMVQLVVCLLDDCLVTVTVAVKALMDAVLESKRNIPKGTIKYIVLYGKLHIISNLMAGWMYWRIWWNTEKKTHTFIGLFWIVLTKKL